MGGGKLCAVMEAEESFLCMGGILKKDDLEFPPILEEYGLLEPYVEGGTVDDDDKGAAEAAAGPGAAVEDELGVIR